MRTCGLIHTTHFHIRVSCKVLSGASVETGFRECAVLFCLGAVYSLCGQMRQESISMKMKEVVSTMVRGGIPAALLLWSVQCMAFRRPSQTRPHVDVSVQQNVFSPTTMDTTVDVTIIKELPPPKYALWDGVETALRHLQLRGVPLTFDNVIEELYVL